VIVSAVVAIIASVQERVGLSDTGICWVNTSYSAAMKLDSMKVIALYLPIAIYIVTAVGVMRSVQRPLES